MVNRAGCNGVDNGTRPPDDELKKSLMLYARKNLSVDMRLLYLKRDHGWIIQKETLRKINRKFDVPSMRKPPPYAISKTLVCEKISQDHSQRNGPNSIQRSLQFNDHLIPRDTIRQIVHEEAPEGSEFRNPATQKKKKLRGHLKGVGVLEEAHGDGHEKLGHLALRMGGVGVNIYAFRDHASGKILLASVVPNDRDDSTIGHVYLDLIEANGLVMPFKMTVDGGPETGWMSGSHHALHAQYLPEVDHNQNPIFLSLQSTDNISIESVWSYWLKVMGDTLKETIVSGRDCGFFIIGNDLHANLFNWLWPQIVQRHLDDFVESFNNSRTRFQRTKILPSGVAPQIVFDFPKLYGLEYMGCQVDQEAVDGLRANLPRSREDCFRWVSDGFNEMARQVYEHIGCPTLACDQGWAVFNKMIRLLDV